MMNTGSRLKRIQGLVNPTEWNEKGQVTLTNILTFDEDELIVVNKDDVNKVKIHTSKFVEIHGDIDLDSREISNIISVTEIAEPRKRIS